MIKEFARYLFQVLENGFELLIATMMYMFSQLLMALKDLLVFLFTPLLQLIGTIFYFLYKLGVLIVAVIELVFKLVFFFAYVMKGLFLTLIGLNYSGAVAAKIPTRYQVVFNQLDPALDFFQLDKVAVLCLWAVWIFVAISVIKVIGARGE